MTNNLYVIGPESGPYKVGIAKDVERRRLSLQTGNPHQLRVHFSTEHPNAKALEAKVHAALKRDRLTGEWFDSTLEVIREAVEQGVQIDVEVTESPVVPNTVFARWLSEMKLAGLGKSDAACARLLGVSANTVVDWKAKGTDHRTALACRALLEGLEAYPG